MGALSRSIPLAIIVMATTVLISLAGGLAFRGRFPGSGVLFYLVIASLVAPGYVLSIGGLMFQLLGLETNWYTSALCAQLSWTLPFGLLIMFAIFGRFSRSYEEASRDLGASQMQTMWLVVIPILLPGMIAVALFGFTLSYDEFARTLQTTESTNTMPIEIWSMMQNVTSPSIYALGTLTSALPFLVIGVSLGSVALIQRHRVAVDGINLRIASGTYCCLLGPSGCGKTTMLRMIAGHESPTGGEILIDGGNVVGQSPRHRGTAMMQRCRKLIQAHPQLRLRIAGRLADKRACIAGLRGRGNARGRRSGS